MTAALFYGAILLESRSPWPHRDIVAAMRLSRATVRKMKQNLVWASVYNLAAIPIAAGVLFPSAGIELRPEWSALLMSASSIIVATNAVLLKGAESELGEPLAGSRDRSAAGSSKSSRGVGADARTEGQWFEYPGNACKPACSKVLPVRILPPGAQWVPADSDAPADCAYEKDLQMQ